MLTAEQLTQLKKQLHDLNPEITVTPGADDIMFDRVGDGSILEVNTIIGSILDEAQYELSELDDRGSFNLYPIS